MCTTFSCRSSLDASIRAKSVPPLLEFQAAFTGALGQLCHTAMIYKAAAVKYDLFDVCLLGSLSNRKTYLAGAFLVAAVAVKALIHAGSSSQSYAKIIIDDLSINVVGGAENGQSGTLGSTVHFAAYSGASFKTVLLAINFCNHSDPD